MAEHQNVSKGGPKNEQRIKAQEVIACLELTPRSKNRDDEFTPIYSLPITPRVLDEENKIRICRYSHPPRENSDPLVIMVVGPTGSGKSTAINALINYLLDVQYDHNYRFELVDLEKDEEENAGNQAYSQTQWVTVYEIYEWKDSPVKRPIFIVDTPGLDDTDGKEKDKQTVRQMKLLFEKHLSNIHAVCITLNGTQPRLTESQRYIFDSINKIFGKDIVNNLYIWATFTDLPKPPVVASLNEYKIKYEKLYTIENGTLYENIPEDTREARKCKNKFEDVYEFFNEFFNKVLLNKSPVSLENTKTVLQEREKIESIKKEIEHKITILINRLEVKNRLKYQLIGEKSDLQKRRDILFKVTILHKDENRKCKVNNCSECKRTCCNPCSHNLVRKLMFHKCCKMTNDGYCKVCRCHISVHSRSLTERYEVEEKSLIEIEEIEMRNKDSIIIDEFIQRDIRDVKVLLKRSFIDNSRTENFISQLDNDIKLLQQKLKKKVQKLQSTISKINELGLYQENPSLIEIIHEIKVNDEKQKEPSRKNCYLMLESLAAALVRKDAGYEQTIPLTKV